MPSFPVCLMSATGWDGTGVREALTDRTDLDIVGESKKWKELQTLLTTRDVEAVILHLDQREREQRFVTVERIAELQPECAIIGVCDDNQPDTIISAMRAGCAQFVPLPLDAADFKAALDRVRRNGTPGPATQQRICLMGSAGGAGTTTISCNLALELADLTGTEVALVDLNLSFGDVACHFDCAPHYGVSDVCRTSNEIDRTMLEQAIHMLPNGVGLLSRPDVDTQVDVHPQHIEHMLSVLGQMYRYVVVDLPRNFDTLNMAALSNADRVLIITQLTVPGLRNATRMREHLLCLGANEEHIGVVVNRGNASHERITTDEVSKHFKRPVYAIVPNDYKHITAARDLGQPMAANSPARVGIRELASRLTNRTEKRNGNGESRGLIGRLLSRKR